MEYRLPLTPCHFSRRLENDLAFSQESAVELIVTCAIPAGGISAPFGDTILMLSLGFFDA